MTLDQAIKHCQDVAKIGGACAEEHRQLAKWLKELRQFKKSLKTVKNNTVTK